MYKIPLIYDCDNTFWAEGCDIDDGLTLLYLLGSPEVELLGITCAYGNNVQDVVYADTIRLLKEWGREDIPVYRGSAQGEDRHSPAAEFLARTAAEKSGELYVLATGSQSNLLGAQEIDPAFMGNVARFSLMGGITETLYVGGKIMQELNLSCDPEASYAVLSQGAKVYLATAQNSLRSFYTRDHFVNLGLNDKNWFQVMMSEAVDPWLEHNRVVWNLEGTINWDVMAAVQMLHPEMFKIPNYSLTPTVESLHEGRLLADGEPLPVKCPEIVDLDAFTEHVFNTYKIADIRSR